MKDEELKGIEERLNNSSRGPWVPMIEGITHYSGDHFIMTGVESSDDFDNPSRGNDIYISSSEKNIDNLIFIAHAKQDIASLLKEIKSLKVNKAGFIKTLEF